MQMFFNSLFSFIVNFEGLNRFDFFKNLFVLKKKEGRDVPTIFINDCLCQFFFALHSIYLSLLALVSFNNLVRVFWQKIIHSTRTSLQICIYLPEREREYSTSCFMNNKAEVIENRSKSLI